MQVCSPVQVLISEVLFLQVRFLAMWTPGDLVQGSSSTAAPSMKRRGGGKGKFSKTKNL